MYRIGQEEIDAVARAIMSRQFFKINAAGQEVYNFEEEWKSLTGSGYMITMTSGFAALSSALIGLGIGPGDEVIVPAYTYIASALAVTSVGAIPVIAEVDDTLTLEFSDESTQTVSVAALRGNALKIFEDWKALSKQLLMKFNAAAGVKYERRPESNTPKEY